MNGVGAVMKFRFVSIVLGLLLLASIFSCSSDGSNYLSGVEASSTSKSQTIADSSSQEAYLSERNVVINRIQDEHDVNVSLLNRNQITVDEYIRRSNVLNDNKNTQLGDIDEKYKAMNGIWSSLETELLINCANPSSTNATIEIDVIFHGGLQGTLQGYPLPLLKGQTYRETVSFRTGRYVDSIIAVRFIKK